MNAYRIFAKNLDEQDLAPYKTYEVVAPDESAARTLIGAAFRIDFIDTLAAKAEETTARIIRSIESTVTPLRP